MATVRVNIGNQNNDTKNLYEEMTLMEKWREHYNDPNRHQDSANFSKKLARLTLALQSTTQLYMFLYYIIPRLFEDSDEWTRYWWKVLTVFLCVELFLNYFCTVLYNTEIIRTRDKPEVQMKERWDNPPEYFESHLSNLPPSNGLPISNGHASLSFNMSPDNGGIPWQYCNKCEMYIPPRAHHCDVCNKCILKRDHHCYFVGTCIGFRNQRYFFVLSFYAVWVGGIGLLFTIKYLQTFYYPVAYSWTNFLPPFAIYRWIFGAEDMSFDIVLLIVHIYVEFLCALLGVVYFTGQTVLVIKGLTMFELQKSSKIKCNNSINQNFRSVFGNFWALNFLFPMIILFKQTEDGYSWKGVKIDHNSNFLKRSVHVY